MLNELAKSLYLPRNLKMQEQRYAALEKAFEKTFNKSCSMIFSAPGRSEICGNHTDHNMGKAIGAAVELDILAAVNPTNNNIVRIYSEGYGFIEVNLNNISHNINETGKTVALLRGIAYKLADKGYNTGGFNAYIVSNVARGSGLSSSAAYEILLVYIFNCLYNEGKISAMESALIAHFAENEFYGKKCGTLDQISCSYGGITAIDFSEPECPVCNPLSFNFDSTGYSMVITDVGSSHADLTADYEAIKNEMQAVAKCFGESYLRGVSFERFKECLPELRRLVGERAILRAFHYFTENIRVDALCNCLSCGDFNSFLNIINDSGRSSYMYLQNIYSQTKPESQSVGLALYMAQSVLCGEGACRVHGGGFGGTVQAYVPNEKVEYYIEQMNSLFGKASSTVLKIRPVGPVRVK